VPQVKLIEQDHRMLVDNAHWVDCMNDDKKKEFYELTN